LGRVARKDYKSIKILEKSEKSKNMEYSDIPHPCGTEGAPFS
jgi:hypothetical protein